MRSVPSIVHLDLDAFFAAVEQRDKPSLRGKPVIVGGVGTRGVVATASYEARVFGVRSAMRTAEARARCPHAAYLTGRFAAYRITSRAVMAVLREISPLVEPVSLDEAYVDLAGDAGRDLSAAGVEELAAALKERVREVTGGVTASVGAGTSKLVAKIASDLRKPDGLLVVEPGAETDLLHPMPVGRIPGVGPATAERLRRIGVHTVGELARAGEPDLVAALGQAHGHALARLAMAEDDRAVVPLRESKSISAEDTFEHDIVDPALLSAIIDRLGTRVCERLTRERLSGRTVTVKIRLFDFTTYTRSATLAGPTDDVRVVNRLARRLLAEVDTSAGVRLLGVGVSGLADWVQEDLFGSAADVDLAVGPRPRAAADVDLVEAVGRPPAARRNPTADVRAGPGHGAEAGPRSDQRVPGEPNPPRWSPGQDVMHTEFGPGWVWGAGLRRVTVRFETAATGPGPVRTFATDDPDLAPYTPLTWDPGLRVSPKKARPASPAP
ncbi:DNA polymerase IV [Actinopolymorpha singaporensis]|uniref:DNA polymerase IV n=1 Tax=Actinopolymorpha singaporensis TaxID=117157 RepID=A0A1H1WD68_9ACTN|nr:DNA polymerase IV [Actinopolymorpha singaporensis]SDS94610.1 DNA polymerase-4 [Actinopolymorpha singaporensis]